MKHPVGIRS